MKYVVKCIITGLYARGEFCDGELHNALIFSTKKEASAWIKQCAFPQNFRIVTFEK